MDAAATVLPEVVAEAMDAMGVEPCTFTAWTVVPHAALLLLFLSVFYRHRAVIWRRQYAKPGRTPPKYSFSAVPYESILALLLAAPRAWSTISITPADFSLDSIRAAAFSQFSWLHWSLVLYIVGLDLFERRQWCRRTLLAYYDRKAAAAAAERPAAWMSKEAKEDSRNKDVEQARDADDDDDGSAADEEVLQPQKKSLRQRLLALLRFGAKEQKSDALQIAVSYQVMAFSKVLCANVFLLNTSTFSCLASRAHEGNLGSTLPWSIITIISAARGLALMMEGYEFAKHEVKNTEIES